MKEPIVLYSVQTYLAYHINNTFYSNSHYVWCTPCFDSNTLASTQPHNPDTSNPHKIYENLTKNVKNKDNHNNRELIEQNIIGLRNGAEARKREGIINAEQEKEILGLIKAIVDNKNLEYFRPVIYVIPYLLVKDQVKKVPFADRALPLSPEYIIENLQAKDFDYIDLNKEDAI